MSPLTAEQRDRVESSMEIAVRAARNASRKRPWHEHQLMSAASRGTDGGGRELRSPECQDAMGRLGIDPSEPCDHRLLQIQVRAEIPTRIASWATRTRRSTAIVDPKGENGLQMVDISDLLAKIPTQQHSLLANGLSSTGPQRETLAKTPGSRTAMGRAAWNRVSRC